MKTSHLRAALAIALFAGLNLSANAGLLRQDVTPAARLGSSPLMGFNAGAPVIVTPMPAQILPLEPQPLPQPQPLPLPLPQPLPLPLPVAIEEPTATAVPEPGTVATLAAGLVLMGVIVRRRRAAPRA